MVSYVISVLAPASLRPQRQVSARTPNSFVLGFPSIRAPRPRNLQGCGGSGDCRGSSAPGARGPAASGKWKSKQASNRGSRASFRRFGCPAVSSSKPSRPLCPGWAGCWGACVGVWVANCATRRQDPRPAIRLHSGTWHRRPPGRLVDEEGERRKKLPGLAFSIQIALPPVSKSKPHAPCGRPNLMSPRGSSLAGRCLGGCIPTGGRWCQFLFLLRVDDSTWFGQSRWVWSGAWRGSEGVAPISIGATTRCATSNPSINPSCPYPPSLSPSIHLTVRLFS